MPHAPAARESNPRAGMVSRCSSEPLSTATQSPGQTSSGAGDGVPAHKVDPHRRALI